MLFRKHVRAYPHYYAVFIRFMWRHCARFLKWLSIYSCQIGLSILFNIVFLFVTCMIYTHSNLDPPCAVLFSYASARTFRVARASVDLPEGSRDRSTRNTKSRLRTRTPLIMTTPFFAHFRRQIGQYFFPRCSKIEARWRKMCSNILT